MRQLIDSTKLDEWFISTRRDAQELLPHLVRRLIYATKPLNEIIKLRIPVGDEVGLPGFDGEVATAGTHFQIPTDRSIWEMGTGDPSQKAASEYTKRSEEPGSKQETTFVFVTPHRWPAKEKWVVERKAGGIWRDVNVIDCVDLAAWIEAAPSVGRWVLHQMGYEVEGLRDIDLFLREIDGLYGVQLTPDLIIGGRTEEKEKLVEWLNSDRLLITVEGDSSEEAAAFIAACIKTLPEQQRLWCESRLLYVDTLNAIENLATSSAISFIVPTTDEVRLRLKALNNQSVRLLFPTGRSVGNRRNQELAIQLGTIRRTECEKALLNMSVSQLLADRISNESKGRLSAVLWMLAQELQKTPPWVDSLEARKLIPLMFAGQWVADQSGDRDAISGLANDIYSNIENTLLRWSTPIGPLVRRGPIWDWLAWDFAWHCLSGFLTNTDLTRFRDTLQKVLSTPDPKFELEADRQWMASVFGKTHPHSSAMRQGLVGTIVHLAIDVISVDGTSGQDIANTVVRDLLDVKPEEEAATRYLSLAPFLPDIAEAAPDEFLKAFEKLMTSPDSATWLFQESDFIFSSSSHVYVLWALERLAWSVEYFARVIAVLGKLAATDKGGKLSNRPIASLTEIFLPWHPQTTATVADRLDAIDFLRHEHPQVAWPLCTKLLPTDHSVSMPTAAPKWRPWKPENGKTPVSDYWSFVEKLIDKMIDWAGTSGVAWNDLIKPYQHLLGVAPPLAEKILDSLNSVPADSFDKEGRLALSDNLRELINRHRSHSNAEWALGEEKLLPIERLYDQIRPKDVVDQNLWLFESWPTLPNEEKLPYEEQAKLLMKMRSEAVSAIWQAGGATSIFDFAERIEAVEDLGRALSELQLEIDAECSLLETMLSTEPKREKTPAKLRMAIGFTAASIARAGDKWINSISENKSVHWDALRYSNLAWGMPLTSETWDRLKKWGDEAQKLYWERAPIAYIRQSGRDADREISELLSAGRPYRAIMMASMLAKTTTEDGVEKVELNADPKLVIEALERAPRQQPSDEWYGPSLPSVSHHIGELLDGLEQAGIDEEKLAALEWIWMSVLTHGDRGLKSLQKLLSTTPEFFIELLCFAFRAETEEPHEVTDEKRTKAEQAYRLLHEWHRIPGAQYGDSQAERPEGGIKFANGTVDQDQLIRWVEQARKLASEKGRLGVCDTQIGNMLAYSPEESGIWPCQSVRNLLEKVRSEGLDHGVELGIYNKRGAYFRAKGGDQERQLRDQFRRYADAIRSKWPFTAAILTRIADNYDREAKREDERDAFEEFE
jgi:hypothetical protein